MAQKGCAVFKQNRDRAARTPASISRRVLGGAILPVGLILTCVSAPNVWADAIFAPSDFVLGGQKDPDAGFFDVGFGAGGVGSNSWPNAESPDHAIDGVAQKYLNFSKFNTGILVTPFFNEGNGSVATSMQLWTANDSPGRDPASYEIWGTNEALDFQEVSFTMDLFTLVSSGSLSLPAGRGGSGTTALNNTNSQTVSFTNVSGYKSYLIVFPEIKDAAANSMQIGEIQLFGTNAFTNVIWAGNVNSTWDIGATQNWKNGAAASNFQNDFGVTFNDSASPGANNITIQAGGAGVKPAAVIFQNNAVNYTISGEPIQSPGGLIIGGTGTVTLNNVNNYQDGTTVNSGTLTIGASGSLGTGQLTVSNTNTGPGTAVTVNFNSAQSIGSLSGTVAVAESGENTATINLNGNLTINQTTEGVYRGVLHGTGGLIKNGSAALTLTGVNTYAGPTVINAGILRSSAPGDNEQGALPAGQPVTVNEGASLIFGADDGAGYYGGSVSSITVNKGSVISAAGTHSTLPAVTLNGGLLIGAGTGNSFNGAVLNYILDGDITTVASDTPSRIEAERILLRKDPTGVDVTAPLTFTVPRGTAPVDLVVASALIDEGAGFIKNGNGIASFTRASATTGAVVLNGGKAIVANSKALGSGAVTVNGGTVLTLGAAPALDGFEDFVFNGGAFADETNSTVTLTENAGNQARSVFSSEPLSISQGFEASFIYTAGGNRLADGFTFTIQNSAPTAVGGAGGALGFNGIQNAAAVAFNIYTGGGQPVGTNYITATAGNYTSSDPVRLNSGNPILIHLRYDSVEQTIVETLTDQVTQAQYTNTFFAGDLTGVLGGEQGYIGFTGATGGQVASQTVQGFSFNNFSTGVALANNLSLAGGATTGIEVLPVSAGGAGTGTIDGTVTFGTGATLNVTGGTEATNTPYSLRFGGQTTIAGDTTINVANNGSGVGSLVIQGALGQSSPSSLIKTGNGSLTIAGAATYTGVTEVDGGSLIVTGSITGGLTTVGTTGTLGGTGTVNAVTVESGGTLAPGQSIGTLNTGVLTMQSGSTLSLEIGNLAADQVKIAGAGTLDGTINLALTLTADPVDNTVFTILDGTAALVGYAQGARFTYLNNALDNGEQFVVTSGAFTQAFEISYGTGGGNDVALTAIPEPGSATSLIAGVGLLLGLRRRRRG